MQVRYIALFYPLLTVIALIIACFKKHRLRLFLFAALQVAVFFGVIKLTTWQTEKWIGVAVFSGFGGWQKANNAMHIVPHVNLSPQDIKDPEIRELHTFITNNFPPDLYPAKDSVVVWFLWSPWGPMKKYMEHIKGNGKRTYLYYWHQASIPLNKWAGYMIRKYPGTFIRHYILPNFYFLFQMSNEALFIFPGPSQEMKDWFQCNNCKVQPRYNFFHNFLAATASKSFNILWLFFALSLIVLFFRSKLHFTPLQYNMLLLVSFFCITYIATSVYASPIVLRYLLVIRHALFVVTFLVCNQILVARKNP
jgi:hypothetical protein